MLEKQFSPRVPPRVAPIESDFPVDEIDRNVFGIKEQVSDVFDLSLMPSRLEKLWSAGKPEILNSNVDFDSTLLVTAVKNLIEVIGKSETDLFASLTKSDYQGLVTVLDDLIDVVGQNESHILASLMDFIGTLIENYEDAHVPELTII
jgi:HTH-type transcriptional regulator/antitoxin HigA